MYSAEWCACFTAKFVRFLGLLVLFDLSKLTDVISGTGLGCC